MLRRLLSNLEKNLVNTEQDLLQRLGVNLARLDAAREDTARLNQARRQLDELFLLVVVGEFNAGKSAFINALLGQELLKEGATPTTTRVHILRHGDQVTRTLVEADAEIITSPIDWLQDINLVDTPGTNAVIQRHQEIAEDFVPRSDLVLFVTSADRPFAESERLFMDRIRAWGKKVVIVVNKIDILDAADVIEVQRFVTENAVKLLGIEPEIFLVSAKMAQEAKWANRQSHSTPGDHPESHGQVGTQSEIPGGESEAAGQQNMDPLGDSFQPANIPSVLELWTSSHFGPLETFILDTLDETERLRLKLLNPLGIAQHLHDEYSEVTEARLDVLAEDFDTIDTVEANLRAYQEDMHRDFRHRLSAIDSTLFQMSDRGVKFFDDTLRFSRIFSLLNAAQVREDFEREVVADTVQDIDNQVSELIDWMVEREYRQWQDVMEYLNRRAELHKEKVIGQVGGNFELNRRELLDSVGRAAQSAVASYDKKTEAAKLADSVQLAVAQTAIIEVSALGLGAILVAALHTLVADVTGLLAAGTLAAVGLYILPNRRRKAREELRVKVLDLQTQLHEALTTQFEQELSRSVQLINEAIQPYTRFVRSEREKLVDVNEEMASIGAELNHLRAQIEAL
ncbi:MAG: dynamin family protein [Chloroflexota bacterium]|nr:dynamin family protein [Chloroflexota bacterium]